jgi:hypothetical protein
MAKKRVSKSRLADLEKQIETQRRRAARPTLPVNTHAPVSKSLREKKESLERKASRRRDWDDL